MKLTACRGTTKVRTASPASGDWAAGIQDSCTPAITKVLTARARKPSGSGLAIGRRMTLDIAGLGSASTTTVLPAHRCLSQAARPKRASALAHVLPALYSARTSCQAFDVLVVFCLAAGKPLLGNSPLEGRADGRA